MCNCGGADINNYEYIKSCMRNDDFIVFCDSGLKHLDTLQVNPSLIVGDFDSHDNLRLIGSCLKKWTENQREASAKLGGKPLLCE